MPTYDYKCLECNFTFEKFQKMSDEQLQNCPSCNGKLKRLIGTGVSPIFKGSGFYQTDYKNNSHSGTKNTEINNTIQKGSETKESKETKPKSQNKVN